MMKNLTKIKVPKKYEKAIDLIEMEEKGCYVMVLNEGWNNGNEGIMFYAETQKELLYMIKNEIFLNDNKDEIEIPYEEKETLKTDEKIKESHKPVKTLQKYRVYDLLEGREVLGHADTMEQVHAIAQEQYDDTDGDCDIHYAELNLETNKYKFSFVKRVMLKGND